MNSQTESQLLLVGIASSAGGINPMMDLIEQAICHKQMAFIIVPHLSRDTETHLPQILDRVTDLKIKMIEDGGEIEPCHLYVLPPNFYATVRGYKFYLEPRPEKGPNKSADILFKSLADCYGENAIGVVLSGSAVGADGSQGVCDIKEKNGHTFVQEPATAVFPQMPELAVDTGCVDFIMPASAIGIELSKLHWLEL